MKPIDLTGNRYHRWTVLSYVGRSYWDCLCDCGTKKRVNGFYLTHGISKSCGCYRDEKARSDNTTHGMCGSRIHNLWVSMHQRCYCTSYKRYKDWGGRGIVVCSRWHRDNPEGFVNFLKDIESLGPAPSEKHTIDRIDNDKEYSPENVRWASKREQRLNQRTHRVLTVN